MDYISIYCLSRFFPDSCRFAERCVRTCLISSEISVQIQKKDTIYRNRMYYPIRVGTMKIVNLSIQTTDSKTMIEPAEAVASEFGFSLELHCYNEYDADEDVLLYNELVKNTNDADLVLVRCMSDPNRFKKFERYEKVLRECSAYVLLISGNSDVTMIYRNLFKGDDESYKTVVRYLAARGFENEKGPVVWLHNILHGTDFPLPDIAEQPTDGIYHPDFPRGITFEDYISELDLSKPAIGIMFTSNLWIYDNLEHINALIREIEKQKMNAIPFFFAVTSSSAGTTKTVDFVKKYFFRNGECLVDAIILNSPFSQLFNSREPDEGMKTKDEDNFFKAVTNVPVFQAMTASGGYFDYEASSEGLNKNEIKNQVAYPEIDGQIITVPVSSVGKGLMTAKRALPIPDRIEHLVKLARNWAKLRHTPAKEKKVAILLWQSREDSGRVGNASGLDSIESVYRLLKSMEDEGYNVGVLPENSKGLLQEFLDGVTNDISWTSTRDVEERAIALVNNKEYLIHYDKIPEFNRILMEKSWGPPPGEISVDGGRFVIPGILKGNVFIGYQPMRGLSEQMESLYHDPHAAIPHQYLEYYRWIQNDFGANAVIHVGTHGTLEWLPGKNVGLSGKCFPDVVLDGLPNIYPYIIDDPGEGIQAKRRSEAVLIGHMNPILGRAGGYDDLDSVEVPLQEYLKMSGTVKGDRKTALVESVYEAVKEADMLGDLGLTDTDAEDFETHMPKLHDYISDMKDAIIRNGLHILGKAPENERMDDAVYSLTRMDNGDIRSLRNSFTSLLGIDILECLKNPSVLGSGGRLNSELAEYAEMEFGKLLIEFRNLEYDLEKCLSATEKSYGKLSEDFEKSLVYLCNTLVPNLIKTSDEIKFTMDALAGNFVLPGPSGAPTRGNADILPTGRNYYGTDPGAIPSRASWKVGCGMADQMIEKYVNEKGTYPRDVAFIIWATDIMKTGGDDMAYILWLMGVRPVWSRTGGQIIDLGIIPLSELKRPRIDVTVRITGLFRDTFPNLIDMIDDAVNLVSELDETDEENYLSANLRKDILNKIERGMSAEDARAESSVRVFGSAPGMYGPGINHAIESGNWETAQDLADIYVAWGSYGYGRKFRGVPMKNQFIQRFGSAEITVKNMPDREFDVIDIDDVYGYLGGLNAFVKSYGNKDAMSVIGDGSNPENTKIRHTEEELSFVFRSKVFNPKYLDGLKQHGYRGVSEIANLTEYLIGWDATSDAGDDWMYRGILEKFLEDTDTREWMKDENPFAMMSILERLQEAINRGLWNATEDEKRRVAELFMQTEERIEEVTDR